MALTVYGLKPGTYSISVNDVVLKTFDVALKTLMFIRTYLSQSKSLMITRFVFLLFVYFTLFYAVIELINHLLICFHRFLLLVKNQFLISQCL